MRCCALLLSSDIKSPPFSPASAGDAPIAAAAAAASLALAQNRALSSLPLALTIELFLLSLAALPAPLLPQAAHAMLCSGGKGQGRASMDSVVAAGLASQRQAGLFGTVAAAFAAVVLGLPPAAAASLVTLLAAAVFQLRCDESLVLDAAQPVARRMSAFAHVVNTGSKKLLLESAFIREQLGLPPR
jgi:hypothetical protein